MKRALLLITLMAGMSLPAAATNVIVRDSGGLLGIRTTCLLLGCNVLETIDGSVGQVFLVSVPPLLSPTTFIAELLGCTGIVDAEVDQTTHVMQSSGYVTPSSLTDESPTSYYGATVWHGYVAQPAAQIIGIASAQTGFNISGSGTVAVIDTGVDPNNTVLQPVLVSGSDFTRNQAGGSEMADVNQSTVAMLDQANPAEVNQSTVAMLDQSTVAMLDSSQYAAFGHGTMTAGIVHLIAPTANIMPLKAFKADGSGKLSDVMRAIYYAAQHGANVANMSFDFPSYSQEIAKAANYATARGMILVASVGNDDAATLVYPAALTNNVIGVASTSNQDVRSSFSNYGQNLVFMAAPGEGVVTTYPFNTYAAGWGTSFSAPMVSGTAALLLSVNPACNQSCAASALANAKYISSDLNHGRLQVFQAVSWAESH